MKKRFLASLLSLVMLLTMLPMTAFAADSFEAVESPATLVVTATADTDSKLTLSVKKTAEDENEVQAYSYALHTATVADKDALLTLLNGTDPQLTPTAVTNGTVGDNVTVDSDKPHVIVYTVSTEEGSSGKIDAWACVEIKTSGSNTPVAASGLTVKAEKGADGKVTLTVTGADTGETTQYLTSTDDPTAPNVGDAPAAGYEEYTVPFDPTTDHTYVSVVAVKEGKITKWGKAQIEDAATSKAATLTATAGTGAEARKITVKNGNDAVTTNILYAFLATAPTVPDANTAFTAFKGTNDWKALPTDSVIPANEGGNLYVVALDKASSDATAVVVGVSTVPVVLKANYTVTIATDTATGTTDAKFAVAQEDGTALVNNALTVESDATGKVKVTYTTGNVITSAVDETGKATVAAGTPTDNTTDGTTSCVYTISAVSADVTVTFTVAAKDEDKSGEITLNKGTGEESNISTLPPKATMENGTATVEITVAAGRTLVAPTSTDFTVNVGTPDSTNKYTVTITLKAATFPESAELTFTTEAAQGGDDGDESFVVTLTKDATSVEDANLVITAPAAVENKQSLTFDADTTTGTVTLTTAKDYVVTATVTPTGAATVSTPTSTGTDTLTWTCTISNVTADATVAFKATEAQTAPGSIADLTFTAVKADGKVTLSSAGITFSSTNAKYKLGADADLTKPATAEDTLTGYTAWSNNIAVTNETHIAVAYLEGGKITKWGKTPITADDETEAPVKTPDTTGDTAKFDTAVTDDELAAAAESKEFVLDASSTDKPVEIASDVVNKLGTVADGVDITIKTQEVNISLPKATFADKIKTAVKLTVEKLTNLKVNNKAVTVYDISFKNATTNTPVEIKALEGNARLTVKVPTQGITNPVLVYFDATGKPVEYFRAETDGSFKIPHLSGYGVAPLSDVESDPSIKDGNADPAPETNVEFSFETADNVAKGIVTVTGVEANTIHVIQIVNKKSNTIQASAISVITSDANGVLKFQAQGGTLIDVFTLKDGITVTDPTAVKITDLKRIVRDAPAVETPANS